MSASGATDLEPPANISLQYFSRHESLLVHDPRSSLRAGDIIEISPGWRVSKDVRHVVNKIIAPFGEPIEARPPIPTVEERIEERLRKKAEKDARRGKIVELVKEVQEGKLKTVKVQKVKGE